MNVIHNGNTLKINRSNQDQNAPFSNSGFSFVLFCGARVQTHKALHAMQRLCSKPYLILLITLQLHSQRGKNAQQKPTKR